MKRFVEGTDRGQATLFPECLADWIDENNPVQVIDVFVDELDLAALGFAQSVSASRTSATWLRRMFTFVLSEKGSPIPLRPQIKDWFCAPTGQTPGSVASSRMTAPPARND